MSYKQQFLVMLVKFVTSNTTRTFKIANNLQPLRKISFINHVFWTSLEHTCYPICYSKGKVKKLLHPDLRKKNHTRDLRKKLHPGFKRIYTWDLIITLRIFWLDFWIQLWVGFLLGPSLLIIKKLRKQIFSVQYYSHKETSQLILKAKSVDWFLYFQNTCG